MSRLEKVLVFLLLSFGLATLLPTPGLAQETDISEMRQFTPEDWRQLRIFMFRTDMVAHAKPGDISAFVIAADNGDVSAQMNLVLRYELGVSNITADSTGVLDLDTFDRSQQDYCLMRYWLTRAAQSGATSTQIYAAWFYGIGVFDKPDAKLSYMYMSKWAELREFPKETWRDAAILLDGEKFDEQWPEEYKSWSPASVPLPVRASCAGCPPGQADQCLADQNSE